MFVSLYVFLFSLLCILLCIALCIVSPFVLSLSYPSTSLPTTATAWKQITLNEYLIIYPKT
jgi:hypothetical protein